MEKLQALQPLPPFVPVSPRFRDLKLTRLSSMPGSRRLFAHGSHKQELPSGYVKIAIENGPVEIVDFPINSMVIFHSFL